MISTAPIVKDVILLGGGHAHAIVIRKWGMKPIPGVRLTLISNNALTPYSGMLPGLIAGHYNHNDAHIDLVKLCQWAGVRFIEDTVTSIDPEESTIKFNQRPPMGFDHLSINTGGAPTLNNVKGAVEYATPVKPIDSFYSRWQTIEHRIQQNNPPQSIAVVGAGAGGFEVLLAAKHKIQALTNQPIQFHWMIRGKVLGNAPTKLRKLALEVCEENNIQCHHGFDVAEVTATSLIATNDKQVSIDEVLWCTEAAAPIWPKESGLDCNQNGFIAVNDYLQSTSHPNIFAAGDVAIQINHPRPRAGVFAVRQGPILFKNLQAIARLEPLKKYRPQQRFLTLISTGQKNALAHKGAFIFRGNWVWRWKHHIDQTFMDRFNKLPAMKQPAATKIPQSLEHLLDTDSDHREMRCGGCGAKVAADILHQTLSKLKPIQRNDQLRGLDQSSDVAVIQPTEPLISQSVDQIRSMIDDPWLFARIATLHALSDLYAAGSIPQSAMTIATLPHAAESVTARELMQIMHGIVTELNQANCTLSGGHTSEGAELSLGFVVNGYLQQDDDDKESIKPEDCVILTKPLGTGVLLAANMRAKADGKNIQSIMRSMLQSNQQASEILKQHQAYSMTDVTGFGLAGHLHELLTTEKTTCTLTLHNIPILEGAIDLSNQGIRSSLFKANYRYQKFLQIEDSVNNNQSLPLLFDPQTSGGLLAIVPKNQAESCIKNLHSSGYNSAVIIGKITNQKSPIKII